MSKISKIREAGREFVMTMAEQHGLDKTALHFGYVRPNGTGNGGAMSNVIKELGWRSDSQKNSGSAVKTATARVIPSSAPKTAPAAVLDLPGRIEDYLIDNILPEGWDENQSIPQHFVELVVLSDTPDWNKRIRRLGQDELDMLEAFLGAPATMNRRENAMLAKLAKAPYERAQARIDAQAQIDMAIETAERRFDASRYDNAIVAFYTE